MRFRFEFKTEQKPTPKVLNVNNLWCILPQEELTIG